MAMDNIEAYNYHLPESQIAKYPLDKRDESNLLVYKNKEARSDKFKNILKYLPEKSLLLFNDTRVISARMIFHKESGARIEIFLLEPIFPYMEMAKAMEVKSFCVWKCTVGNKRKWKDEQILERKISVNDQSFTFRAELVDRANDLVRFSWSSDSSFAEIINQAGHVPIPPYLNRNDEQIDQNRYQTVYSQKEGAVAAPTAGLHFTDEIIDSLQDKDISSTFVTLHVSAGTFKPVQEKDFKRHDMHNEQIIVSKKALIDLQTAKAITCVGTTSLRTLESLYWIGVKKMKGLPNPHVVEKLLPYQFSNDELPDPEEVINFLVLELERENSEYIIAQTEIFIFPSYTFRYCHALITNFHLPKSTLLLLIAAFVGEEWKNIYEYALRNDFRFLSYGDSSILFRD